MKILQIASGDFFSTYGGGQIYVKNIVDEWIRRQQNVTVISFVSTSTGIKKRNYQNIDLFEVGSCEASELKDLIHTISPGIIHAHSQKALTTQIGQELHIPVVITAHHGGILCPAGALMNRKDTICHTKISHRQCLGCCLRNIYSGTYWYPFMKLLPQTIYLKIGKLLEKMPFLPFITPIGKVALSIDRKQKEWKIIAEKCTCMIAPSHAIEEAMIRNGLCKEKIIVTPHGIPLPAKKALPLSIPKEQIKFFYVGRICYVKGIHVLLEAFNQLSNQETAELHLIGGTGNKTEKQYMKHLQKKYASNKNIIWHGKVNPDKIYNMIQEYHIQIHPTICLEVFGLNIAEALAMGKPVLATRCGGAEMQIEDEINGWLINPNDTTALRDKMEEIIDNRYQIKTMLSNTTTKVISIREHVDKLNEIYPQIL